MKTNLRITIVLGILLLFPGLFLFSQVSINNDGTGPDQSAMLDLKSTNHGILIPRISSSMRALIPSPATGLLIFNTTTNQINFYNGHYWCQIDTAFASSTIGTLSLTGGVSINSLPDVIPANSALLDVNNPTRGILIPRTTPDSITDPATGLIIYNTAMNMVCYFNGSQWISLSAFSTGVTGFGGNQSAIGVAIKPDNSLPDPSAILDVSAIDRGVLFPRLSNSQRDALLPAVGLVIYNTSTDCFEFYNGSVWYQLLGNTLSPNVVILDTFNYQLLSDSVQLSQGIYIFLFSGTPPSLEVGDIITGPEGDGFLRKITSIVLSGNPLTLQTQQATMEELFDNADIGFETLDASVNPENITVNYLADSVSFNPNGFIFDFSNTVLIENDDLTFTITDGSAIFNPNFIADIRFRSFKLAKFQLSSENSTLSLNCNINLHTEASTYLTNFYHKLADFDLRVPIPGLPVWVVINTKLNAVLGVSADAAIDLNTGFSDTYNANIGVNYEDSVWTGISNITDSLTVNSVEVSGPVQLQHYLYISPEVSIKFYGIVCPYFSPWLFEQFNQYVATPSMDWNSSFNAGLYMPFGAATTILGNVPEFTQYFYFNKELWYAPDSIEIVSGNNQQDTTGQPLTNPLIVLVKDNLGNPLSNVRVYFQVTQGGGSVSPSNAMTNSSGYAETTWTLGLLAVTQEVIPLIKNAYGQIISSTNFTATALFPCPSYVIYSGQTYNTVSIGTQCWFKENLNIGVRINAVQVQTNNNIIEKYCLDDNEVNCNVYGGLYQWDEAMQYSAIEGTQGICPVGWHLPTHGEWDILSDYLFYGYNVGGKMKETGYTHWFAPNTGATNESNFTGLPGGMRFPDSGTSGLMGYFGEFWSSSMATSTLGNNFYLYYNSANFQPSTGLKTYGFSCRCLKTY